MWGDTRATIIAELLWLACFLRTLGTPEMYFCRNLSPESTFCYPEGIQEASRLPEAGSGYGENAGSLLKRLQEALYLPELTHECIEQRYSKLKAGSLGHKPGSWSGAFWHSPE